MIMRRYDSTEKSKEISGKYLVQAEDFFSFFFLIFPSVYGCYVLSVSQ